MKKGVLKNFAKFTGKYLCQILFFNKVVPVNFAKFLRTPFLQKTSERLLLTLAGLEILPGIFSCGKYKQMATHAESICCLDEYEICQSYFKGILSFVFDIFLSSNFLERRK